MSCLRSITHANVTIDPAVPVHRWGLNDEGVRRTRAMLNQPWIAPTARVVCSAETKAVDTAAILSQHVGADIEVRADTGENGRTATGFLPPAEFEQVADMFFANPDESVRGWERAIDAQARIVAGLADLLDGHATTDTAVVGHGAVGTLWYCHLTSQPIERRHDQPGPGHYFTVNLTTQTVLHWWRAIDKIES